MPHKTKSQRPGNRRGLDKLDSDRVAEPVCFRMADERATRLVETEIFVADGTCRDKTIGAGLVELNEQAGTGYAGNVPIEDGANAVGQEMRDQPIGGFALRLHRTAFGDRNVRRDLTQRASIDIVRETIQSELLRADERPMHDKVGIASDR